jgi:regulator of sirC expression with transglutaminase-like and TPR domain
MAADDPSGPGGTAPDREREPEQPWWLPGWIAEVGRPAEEVRLDRAATLLAAHGLTGRWAERGPAAVDRTVALLDELASACPERSFESLHAVLFGRLGFTGDRERYHAPRNSFLPLVLERRRGIPITLALVVLETARRLDVPMVAIGMPGHFLTAHDGPDGRRWLDAFDGGRVLGLPEVAALHGSMFAGSQEFDALGSLPEVDNHAVLTRMLANLRTTSTFTRDVFALADVVWMRQHLPGPTVTERREHIRLCLAVGRFRTARTAIDALARAVGEDAQAVREDRARLAALLS